MKKGDLIQVKDLLYTTDGFGSNNGFAIIELITKCRNFLMVSWEENFHRFSKRIPVTDIIH